MSSELGDLAKHLGDIFYNNFKKIPPYWTPQLSFLYKHCCILKENKCVWKKDPINANRWKVPNNSDDFCFPSKTYLFFAAGKPTLSDFWFCFYFGIFRHSGIWTQHSEDWPPAAYTCRLTRLLGPADEGRDILVDGRGSSLPSPADILVTTHNYCQLHFFSTLPHTLYEAFSLSVLFYFTKCYVISRTFLTHPPSSLFGGFSALDNSILIFNTI